MTLLRQLTSPTGLLPGDHVCWPFSGAADFAAAVLPFLVEGCQRGEQLLLVGSDEAELLSLLTTWPESDRLLADGQLEVRAVSDVYGRDPEAQVAYFRGEVDQARRCGRSGLRVAADLTASCGGDHVRLHAYERRADELIRSAGLTGMCLYDEVLGAPALGSLAVLHAVHRCGRGVPLVHLSGSGSALSLHGELDLDSADHLRRVLVDTALDLADDGEAVLDLADLTFLDLAGARALLTARDALEQAGVRLELVRPRRLPVRVLALLGWATSPAAGSPAGEDAA